jgi:hypothetical protein
MSRRAPQSGVPAVSLMHITHGITRLLTPNSRSNSMALSMYQASVPVFIKTLGNLSTVLYKSATARLAGVEVPSWEDNGKSIDDLKARIAKTIDYCKEFKPGQIDGAEDRDIHVKVAGNPVTYKGQPYLLHSVLPNFFFHTTTAYDILRHCGVEIGKRDFIGQV